MQLEPLRNFQCIRAFAYLKGCSVKSEPVGHGVYMAATYALYGKPRIHGADTTKLASHVVSSILNPPAVCHITDAETEALLSKLRNSTTNEGGNDDGGADVGNEGRGVGAKRSVDKERSGNEEKEGAGDDDDDDDKRHKQKKKSVNGDGSDGGDDGAIDGANGGVQGEFDDDALFEELRQSKVGELRNRCREMGLYAQGKKMELIERIMDATENEHQQDDDLRDAEPADEPRELIPPNDAAAMAAGFADAVIKAMSTKAFFYCGGQIGFACMHLYDQRALAPQTTVPLTAACKDVELQGKDAIVAVSLARMGFSGSLLCFCSWCVSVCMCV